MLAVAIPPRGSMATPKGEATLSRKLSHRQITPTARSGRVLVAEHQVESSLHSLNSYSRDFVSQTDIRLQAGWLYLVAVLDWHARYVVAWALDQTLALGFVLEAVDQAREVGCPTSWNSDQGSHFTSPQYLDRLDARGIQISMDGKGRALDNIFTERLWRTVTYEEVYLRSYGTPREARQSLAHYRQFYNHERPHQALGYRTPAEAYLNTTPPLTTTRNDTEEGDRSTFYDLAPVSAS